MRKRSARNISRETPETPSPEHLPSKKVRRLPSPPQTRVLRRKGTPTCCNFGKDRQVLYPEYFFCHNCHEWETHSALGIKGKVSRPTSLPCTANHTSFLFPSTKVNVQFHVSKKPRKSVSSLVSPLHLNITDDITDDFTNAVIEPVPTPTSPSDGVLSITLQSCQHQLKQKDETIEELNRKLTNSKKLLEIYKKRANNNVGKDANEIDNDDDIALELDEAIVKAINNLLISDKRFRRYGRACKAKLIAKAIFSDHLFHGFALPFIVDCCKKWLRQTVFSPWKVLKAMDLAGGSCNYKGIEVLRSLESGGKRYYHGSVLPSTAEIKRAAKELENKAQELVPFKEVPTPWGKSIQFCEARIVRLACDMYGITEKAKRQSISISESIDASQITKNLHVITAGFKMQDIDAVNPITGKALCVDGIYDNVQSRDHVFPVQLLIAKETKESYEAFRGFFNFFALAGDKTKNRSGTPYFWEALDGFEEIELTATMDMSASWKGLRKGGACKQRRFFCHCCPLESDNVHIPNEEKCGRFCAQRDDVDWLCYHHSITSDTQLQQMKENISEIQLKLTESIECIEQQSKLKLYSQDNIARKSDRNSIDYEPADGNDAAEYTDLLYEELELRNLDMTGSLEEMRDRLKESLHHETRMRLLLDQVHHCEGVGLALFLVMQAVPCILHCENRSCIKVITMVVSEGISNAEAGHICSDAGNSKKRRIEAFISRLEKIINTKILGDEMDPLQWECPTEDDGKSIGSITLDNNRARKIVANAEELVNLCVPESDRREQLLFAIRKFNAATAIMRQKSDFTDDQIQQFQANVDDFFQVWVRLYSYAGCTNYIHLLSSGHIAEYMFRWRNLHRFSQQGWEHFNSLLKVFFFRRTAHGGHIGWSKAKEASVITKNKLRPIGLWLQRRMMWLCGIGDKLFSSKGGLPSSTADGDDDLEINNDSDVHDS